MVIFGRFSLWAFAAILTLGLVAAIAAEHPVVTIAGVAIVAILAIYAWRARSTG